MNEQNTPYNFSDEEWKACIKVLHSLKDDPFNNPDNTTFGALITMLYKKAKKTNRKESYSQKKLDDLDTILNTEISKTAIANSTLFHDTPKDEMASYKQLNIPKNCYSCNQSYSLAHSFYNRLCPDCAELNYSNRFKTVDLTNRNVILTGGRVKIGYATALKVLRANANLALTTRFPASALAQLKQEKDYDTWKDNLLIYGLDLRNLKEVERFITYYKSNYSTLEILINNAAQTIKYTDQYYIPLIKKEQQLLDNFVNNQKLISNKVSPTEILSLESAYQEKDIMLSRFGQPVDSREKNSWNSTLPEISMLELMEVNLINQISPYFLIKELLPLLKASGFNKKHIINVTSSEGQFSYGRKTIFHPHTNMTKAALNMMTKTSAPDFEKYSIYMNAVDVGWISTGAKESLREKQFERGYIPPLDPVDGASRIIHPIYEAEINNFIFVGKLLKNYRIEEW